MKNNLLKMLSVMPAVILFTACEYFNPPPQMTSLQIQSIQSRTFETGKRIAFDSTVTVFQDLGYIINSAEYNTGFITAESPTNSNLAFFGPLSEKTKATAFIQEIKPNETKIRLNFVAHNEYATQNGNSRFEDTAVINPQMYQNAFTKIQEQIFIVTPFANQPVTNTEKK